MVLDDQAASAAFHGDVDALKAWLAADPSRDVNDYAISPHNQNIKLTLLTLAVTGRANEAKLSLVRWLLAHGADPTSSGRLCHDAAGMVTPLYIASACRAGSGSGEHTIDMVSTFLEAAPLSSQISKGMTHLRSPIVNGFSSHNMENASRRSEIVEVIRLLLRHGAPLDDYAGYTGAGPRFSADTCLSTAETSFPYLAHNEAFIETKALIAGVRACGGSWKSYCRLPHKQILRLRSLLSRGRARPRREPILEKRAAAYRSIVFLCKLGDNGVVWKILEFWQATR